MFLQKSGAPYRSANQRRIPPIPGHTEVTKADPHPNPYLTSKIIPKRRTHPGAEGPKVTTNHFIPPRAAQSLANLFAPYPVADLDRVAWVNGTWPFSISEESYVKYRVPGCCREAVPSKLREHQVIVELLSVNWKRWLSLISRQYISTETSTRYQKELESKLRHVTLY